MSKVITIAVAELEQAVRSRAFLLGLLVALGPSDDVLSLLGVGFCGGLTTYSAFAVQTHDQGPRRGALLTAVTIVPALALCTAGFWLGSR